MNARCVLLTIMLASVAAPPRLLSQRAPRPFVTLEWPRESEGPTAPAPSRAGDNPWEAAVGGIFGGALGFWLGGLATAAVVDCTGDLCELGLFGVGALGGEVLGMTVGAHFANGRRGNFALDLLAAGATGALGLVVLGEDSWGFYGISLAELGAIFLAQLAATAGVERALTH